MSRETEAQLLLGEWACLGILYEGPSHGFAIAARLKPTGDIGRVWSLSRPLTYRSLEQLSGHGYVETVGEEPGIAGGNRTILAATRSGRAQLRKWLRSPVVHLRDIRSGRIDRLQPCPRQQTCRRRCCDNHGRNSRKRYSGSARPSVPRRYAFCFAVCSYKMLLSVRRFPI